MSGILCAALTVAFGLGAAVADAMDGESAAADQTSAPDTRLHWPSQPLGGPSGALLWPLVSPPGPDPGELVFSESGDGPEDRLYASEFTNGEHPLWHVEPGSSPVARVGGSLRKVDSERFHRMFSTERFGGPGSTVTISYRARATAIRPRSGSTVVEGAKVGMKWPVDQSETGYAKDDPRSVEGTSDQENESSPGSYAFVTGLTEDGYMELSRNGYGSEEYTFFPNDSTTYIPGEWEEVVIQLDWLDGGHIRVRYWHGPTATGAPAYDVTDENSPFWDEPGYLWLRSDDTDWEYDFLTVHERPS